MIPRVRTRAPEVAKIRRLLSLHLPAPGTGPAPSLQDIRCTWKIRQTPGVDRGSGERDRAPRYFRELIRDYTR